MLTVVLLSVFIKSFYSQRAWVLAAFYSINLLRLIFKNPLDFFRSFHCLHSIYRSQFYYFPFHSCNVLQLSLHSWCCLKSYSSDLFLLPSLSSMYTFVAYSARNTSCFLRFHTLLHIAELSHTYIFFKIKVIGERQSLPNSSNKPITLFYIFRIVSNWQLANVPSFFQIKFCFEILLTVSLLVTTHYFFI